MINATRQMAAATIGLVLIGLASAGDAQAIEKDVSRGRATAIRNCCGAAQKYPDYTWGVQQADHYRTCMAPRGQHE